ncbi:gliding motility-associated C-terminal domain-containing protein [Myroides sp. WP-1]|uniref:T9SS type B sorting domain-containing protein n=1 Tax=Myroides sp. WP-1 TaxID=2759944 RepID=UPI0015F90338|nr:gliding motility-associated C-terminal domain-containing protein [Myroides sp. WP-1]MBB1139724.1 gliding motility-associated C-terminal domain-containing protein [Myroides sp. WP-1]
MPKPKLYNKNIFRFLLFFCSLPLLALAINRDTGYLSYFQTPPPIACEEPITDLPFIELFDTNSSTKDCWAVYDENQDDITWEINPWEGSAKMGLEGTSNQVFNDWLISPKITLTGNQRLRFVYTLKGPDIIFPDPPLSANLGVYLSTEGTNPENFTHTLVQNTRYNYRFAYREIVIDLKDAQGNPFVGEVNIGFHLTYTLYLIEGAAFNLYNIIVEDINTPITPAPVDLPYFTDFEDSPPFEYVNDDTNMWHIGSAVNHGGSNALYISNDGGDTHAGSAIPQASSAYIDINLSPENTELIIEFDYLLGDSKSVSIFLTSINEPLLLRLPMYRRLVAHIQGIGAAVPSNTEFQHFKTYVNLIGTSTSMGNPVRLVFQSFKNDVNTLPIAIDNLSISYRNCSTHFIGPHDVVRPLTLNLSVTNITSDSAILDMVNDNGIFGQYDFIVSPTPLNLDTLNDATVPTHANVTLPFHLTGLAPLTSYYVYFRRSCGENNKGRWKKNNSYYESERDEFRTTQIPASLPFFDDFEEEFNWDYSSYYRTTENGYKSWYHGSATSSTGTHSLYISQDQGETYTYSTAQRVLANFGTTYRDISIPTDVSEIKISYDYQVGGEIDGRAPSDYFTLIASPLSHIELPPFLINPVPDYNWLESLNIITLGEPYYVHSSGWKTETVTFDVRAYQGEIIRFGFLWRVLNTINGVQPPAAIDNFRIETSSCVSPTDLQADFIDEGNSVQLSWTPQGDTTKWEVFIIEQGENAPTQDDQGIIVEEPSLLVENINEGTYYLYYVRAICDNLTPNHQGFWKGPKKYGYIKPSICMEIEEQEINLPQNEKRQYIICGDQPHTQTLKADYFIDHKTDDYTIEEIVYEPPFPFFGDDVTTITTNNTWSSVIDLGFDFCFYDNTYNKVLVSPNSAITFSIAGITEQGRYTPNSNLDLIFDQTIPNESTGTEAPFVNAILGAMQALDPNSSPEDHSVNYKVYGAFPCRAFVFNVYKLALIGTNNTHLQTTQIVLYEGTNVIEVYVNDRPVIQSNNPHNNANGVLGIQNATGTQARSPYQRNTGAWSAYEEAWRFVPNGTSTVDFKWYKNEEVFSEEKEITITIDQEDTYTARASYTSCTTEERIIERVYDFIRDDFQIPVLPNYSFCSESIDPEKTDAMPIAQHKTTILELLNAEEGANFEIEFYYDEALTQLVEDTIHVKDTQTIYVKIINTHTSCTKTAQFQAIRLLPIQMTQLDNVEACSVYILPELKENEAYFTQSKGKGKQYNGGDTYDQLGRSTLYIYLVERENDCITETSFDLLIQEKIKVAHIPDQRLECEIFILPELPLGNRYYTEPGATGEELMPGTPIIEPTTIYIYTKIGSDAINCTEESSFHVDFLDCTLPKGFSPNDDGQNDSFDLSNYGISSIKIFNRNGTEVYSHGKGYTNQWTGKDKNGKKLPPGTYFYTVIANGKHKTGWVHVNY